MTSPLNTSPVLLLVLILAAVISGCSGNRVTINGHSPETDEANHGSLHILPGIVRSKKVDRALGFFAANFSTHATNHFYVAATHLDRAEPLTASVYWKEARLLMDYGELADDAPDAAEIFALSHPLKLDRDTVDTPEDIAGSTYLETHRQWVAQMERCISIGTLYVIRLDEATNRFPNTDRSKADNE